MPVLTDRDKVIFGHFLCAHSSARALKACIQCIKETKTTEIASLLHKNKNHSYQEQSMFFDVPLGLHGIISWYLHVALINYSPTINILIPESNCRNLAITTSLPCFSFSFSISVFFFNQMNNSQNCKLSFFCALLILTDRFTSGYLPSFNSRSGLYNKNDRNIQWQYTASYIHN